MALTVCTYLWGNKYGPADVAKLASSVRRNMQQDFRFVVISDGPVGCMGVDEIWPIHDMALTRGQGCFARLRMFDPLWQNRYGVEKLVCLDLDMVITGPLDPLFDHDDEFMILQGANASNPCPYNGSVWMLRAGYRPDVWSDFSLDAAKKVPFYIFPDDQAWLAHKLPDAAGWQTGHKSGIWSFGKRGWPPNNNLPEGARIVAFPGSRNPKQFEHLPWVKQHWR